MSAAKAFFMVTFSIKRRGVMKQNSTRHEILSAFSFFFFLGQKLTNAQSERVDVSTAYVKPNNKGAKMQFSSFINCDQYRKYNNQVQMLRCYIALN